MNTILPIAQSIIAILLIIFILVQQRGTALGSAFGGEGGSFYSTRRGIQKKIFWATIISGALFIILALLNLVI
ncbi:preprotein translocase subunit SecG [Patescibacteria group bacterium]|nr:preprotein translocase subunit SecG [Patescibacteria group bacterium]